MWILIYDYNWTINIYFYDILILYDKLCIANPLVATSKIVRSLMAWVVISVTIKHETYIRTRDCLRTNIVIVTGLFGTMVRAAYCSDRPTDVWSTEGSSDIVATPSTMTMDRTADDMGNDRHVHG